MKFCEYCGRENEGIAVACRGCGFNLAEPADTIVPALTLAERHSLVRGLVVCLTLCLTLLLVLLPGYLVTRKRAAEMRERRIHPIQHPAIQRGQEHRRVMVA
jgi:hypothetical protein